MHIYLALYTNVSLYLHMYLLYLSMGIHTYLRNCVHVCVAYEYMKRMTNGCRRMKMNKHSNTHFRAAAGNNPKPEQNFKELHALPLSLCRSRSLSLLHSPGKSNNQRASATPPQCPPCCSSCCQQSSARSCRTKGFKLLDDGDVVKLI